MYTYIYIYIVNNNNNNNNKYVYIYIYIYTRTYVYTRIRSPCDPMQATALDVRLLFGTLASIAAYQLVLTSVIITNGVRVSLEYEGCSTLFTTPDVFSYH